MRTRTKLISIVLTLAMVLSLLPTVALAEEPVAPGGDTAAVVLNVGQTTRGEGDNKVYSFADAMNVEGILELHLVEDVVFTAPVTITKSVTIDGAKDGMSGKNGEGCYTVSAPITGEGARAFNMDGRDNTTAPNSTVTFKNIRVVGPSDAGATYTRGISAYRTSGLTLNLENAYVSANYYAVNIASENTDLKLNVKDSCLEGWCAFQLWSPATVNVQDSVLSGINDKSYDADGWNDYATIVVNQDATESVIKIIDTTVKATTTNGNIQKICNIQNILNTGDQALPVGNKIEFTGCKFETEGTCDFNGTGQAEKLIPLYRAQGGNSIVVDGKEFFAPESPKNAIDEEPLIPVAQNGSIYFGRVETAIKYSKTGSTITLLRDAEMNAYTGVNGERTLTLDLGGHTLESSIYVFYGDLTVRNGTVTGEAPFDVYGRETNDGKKSALTIAEDVTIQNPTWGIILEGYGSYDATTGYGAEVNLYGTIEANAAEEGTGIFISGNLGNVGSFDNATVAALNSSNVVNVYGNIVSPTDQAIAMNGQATVNVYDGAIVEGDTPIGVKRGTLNVLGGTISAYGEKVDPAQAEHSGTERTGAAISVTNTYNYAGLLDVNISGGAIESLNNAALYVGHSCETNGTVNPYIKGLTLHVTDGCFYGSEDAVIIADKISGDSDNYPAKFITGGHYTSSPAAYLADGLMVVSSTMPRCIYTVGEQAKVGDTEIQPAPDADPVVNVDAIDAADKDAVTTAINNATSKGLDAAAGAAATTEIDKATVEKGVEEYTNKFSGATAENVKLVVQPYMDIKATGYTSAGTEKTFEVEITPKYNVLATSTGTDVANLITSGDGQNAVVVEPGKELPVDQKTQVEISFQLPAGFITTAADVNNVYVKHTKKNGTVETYQAVVTKSGSNPVVYTATFTTNGFSPFAFTVDTRTATVQYKDKDGAAIDSPVTYLPSDVGSPLLDMTAPSGQGFSGWSFEGVSGTYKTLTEALLTALDALPASITATPVFYYYGGSSSSSGSSNTFTVSKVSGIKNGTVSLSKLNASKGDTVTLTVKPDAGYVLDTLTVTDENGNTVKLTDKGNGKFTFVMPASQVEVKATFKAEGTVSAPSFTDVADGYWAGDAIAWAYEQGYMNGTSATTFNPGGNISRQQLWMILARHNGGAPADMAAAKAWAVANGVSDGSTPGGSITRQQMVTILYRYAQMMGMSTAKTVDISTYPDAASVAAYAQTPMAWAVANGIISGTTAGTLAPAATATRAQFAVILYRFCQQNG